MSTEMLKTAVLFYKQLSTLFFSEIKKKNNCSLPHYAAHVFKNVVLPLTPTEKSSGLQKNNKNAVLE